MWYNGEKIDSLTQEMIATLDDGPMNTTELRDELGVVGDDSRNRNRKVKRRFDTLSNTGLATIESGGTTDGGRTLPNEATLTEEGHQFAADHDLDTGAEPTDSITDRLDRLDRQLTQTQNQLSDTRSALAWTLAGSGLDPEDIERLGLDPEDADKF